MTMLAANPRSMRHTKAWCCALLCVLPVLAFAAPPLTLWIDPSAAGPGKFAEDEIRREATARGRTVVIPKQTENVGADVQMAREWQPGSIDETRIKRMGTEAGFRK